LVKSAEDSAETLARSDGEAPAKRSNLAGGNADAEPARGGGGRESGADGPTDVSATGWKQVLMRTWTRAGEDNLELISAGVAFYFFLALLPLLLATVLTYGVVADPAAVAGHIAALSQALPEEAASIIGDQLENMVETAGTTTGFALLLALGFALYSAQRGANAIIIALNIVYNVEEGRSFLKRLAASMAITLGAVLTFLLASLGISALGFMQDLLPDVAGVVHMVVTAGFWLAAAAAASLAIALIYRYAPNRKEAKWRWITPGSALATAVWLAATFGFAFYVSNFANYNATYGSLGAVVIFLTWLYLSAYILLLGAELNAELAREVGGRDKEGE
jgi:membrane protein